MRSARSSRTCSEPTIARIVASVAGESAEGSIRTFSSATGGRACSPTPTVSARNSSACAGSPGGCSGSPQPHQRMRGAPISATDSLQAIEPLVERRLSRAADHEAAKAREEAGQLLLEFDRHARAAVDGLETDARARFTQHARKRRALELLL